MKELQKLLFKIEARIIYLLQVKDYSNWGKLDELKENCDQLKLTFFDHTTEQLSPLIRKLNESITFLEGRAEEHLTPMERVRIVRSAERFSLKDILENVYEEYTELGGEKEASIDPAMVCAKATITRQIKNSPHTASVMVIGQETGHGAEFRNLGSCKPQGNEKALHYMRVAETEGIPIHFYIFTPNSSPVEEGSGAAQQIARNIYAMAKLKVPIVSMISEGGSGGAEAIGLSDYRIMCSHGYYSVISPENAAYIEGKIPEDSPIPAELIEVCANRLQLTAEDNLKNNTIDRIIYEPRLGAKKGDFVFFANLRAELLRATDKVVLSTKNFNVLRTYESRRKRQQPASSEPQSEVQWGLSTDETAKLLALRSKKYWAMGKNGFGGTAETNETIYNLNKITTERVYSSLRYDVLKTQRKRVGKMLNGISGEGSVMLKRLADPINALIGFWGKQKPGKPQRLITYTGNNWQRERTLKQFDPLELTDTFTNPLANKDRTISCPKSAQYRCKDLWIPDLYGEFSGVCETCGYHFPLGYQWYLENIFDLGSIEHFNTSISAGNPLDYTGFSERLKRAKAKTGRRAGNMTFHAKINDIKIIVTMLYSEFLNGTVGSAEGEKFAQACALAKQKKRPLLAYVHTTGGIRIQEGTLGLIQMPKCTMAVREYIDAGGLYLVVYDNNSYAGPVASFLGCAPYQFAIRSSRIGFAGRRITKEATGRDIPPDYHSARNALKRGHIQGIWDRREFRRNLHKSLMTLGNPSLYYR